MTTILKHQHVEKRQNDDDMTIIYSRAFISSCIEGDKQNDDRVRWKPIVDK